MIERLLWTGAPLDWNAQACSQFAEIFERPTFFPAAGKGMDHGEILNRRRRDGNPRDSLFRRRERGEKREGEMADRFAKLGTVGSVPGVDGIEGFEFGYAGVFDDAEQVEAGVGDGARAAGEADERKHGTGGPDFGVSGAGGFERGQRQDEVADGAGADQEPAFDRGQDRLSYWREMLTGSVRSTVLGGRHMRSSQA